MALNLALGLFCAVFLGGTAVFFAELGRDTVCSPYELEGISRVPVLATVPLGAVVSLRGEDPWRGGGAAPAHPRAPWSPDAGSQVPPLFTAFESERGQPAPFSQPVPAAEVASEADAAKLQPEPADEQQMKPTSPPHLSFAVPVSTPVLTEAALVVRPRALGSGARSFDQLAAVELEQRRRVLDAANLAKEPEAREPRAYPMAPPRLERAVRREYQVVSERIDDAPAGSSPGPGTQDMPAAVDLSAPNEIKHRSVARPAAAKPADHGVVRRPLTLRDAKGRGFVTSTFDPRR